MNIRKSILSGFLATSMALGGATAFAQDIQDPTDGDDDNNKVEVALLDKDGRFVATADFEETDDGVKIVIDDTDNEILSEGWLGVHIHEVGMCDGSGDFDSAGGHLNPSGETHGDLNADPSHAGDLGNMEVNEDGDFEHDITAEKLSWADLNDADGSAIIIHSGEDDLTTDPSGESGDRFACGVIFPAQSDDAGVATPVGTEDEMTPEATPAS